MLEQLEGINSTDLNEYSDYSIEDLNLAIVDTYHEIHIQSIKLEQIEKAHENLEYLKTYIDTLSENEIMLKLDIYKEELAKYNICLDTKEIATEGIVSVINSAIVNILIFIQKIIIMIKDFFRKIFGLQQMRQNSYRKFMIL